MKEQSAQGMLNAPSRYAGIDYLRAFLSICVVAWHGHTLKEPSINTPLELAKHTLSAADFINYHILLAAVPSFALVSCFLYVSKNRTAKYLTRRLYYLCLSALFWTIMWKVYEYGYHALYSPVPKSLKEAAVMVLMSGTTVYYFLISLCIVTSIAHFSNKLSTPLNIALCMAAILMTGILPIIAIKTNSPALAVYWNPLNFIAYPFAAIVICRLYGRLQKLMRLRQLAIFTLLLAAAALFAIVEWRYFLNPVFLCGQKIALPVYARPSVVVTAAILLSAFLLVRLPSHPIVSFMSKYSFSLYCLHMFCFDFIYNAPFAPFVNKSPWIGLTLMVGGSYLAAVVLKVFVKDKYIVAAGGINSS
ncbi:MAG: acyltransferase [Candidatus Magnetominusculus sp. LBB02]|nr:acyltransferase [Candidatus Magnetominusculus sp. LBB02]